MSKSNTPFVIAIAALSTVGICAVLAAVGFGLGVFDGLFGAKPADTGASSASPPATTATAQQPVASINYPLSEYKLKGTAQGGYTYEATLQIGPWVKAFDTDSMNSAWKAVGGFGEAIIAENFHPYGYHYDQPFSPRTSAMAFGTLTVVDTTPGGFKIADSKADVSIGVYSKDLNNAHLVDSCTRLIQGTSYLHMQDNLQSLRDKGVVLLVSPHMMGREWGPYPVVVCCADALSPEYPDGDPDALNAMWTFGDNVFRVPSVWTRG